MAESQAFTVLGEALYDDPSQLSQALRQRAVSPRPPPFTTSTESNPSVAVTASLAAPQPCPVAPANPGFAPSHRRADHANYVKPALSKFHSAPTNAGYACMAEADMTLYKMHHSFNGMDAPGDTQPDSQMHKQWTSGVFAPPDSNDRGIAKSLFMEHKEDEDEDDLPSEGSEAAESSQNHINTIITSPTVIGMEDHSEVVHQNSLALTSPMKFETPAFAGRKRNSSGQMLSSAMRTNTTPGTVASASAFFGAGFGNGGAGGGSLISLTQAFHNTQAPTSPAVGGVNEDAVFSRPSPNFTNVRPSSPMPEYSSPTKAVRPETPRSDPPLRSSSEPRAEYVTLEQSQQGRKMLAGDKRDLTTEQDSWDDLSRKVKAKKARQNLHNKAARSLSHISAPALVSPRSTKHRMGNTRSLSPVKAHALRHEDEEEDEDSMEELSQPRRINQYDGEESCDEMSQEAASAVRAGVKQNSSGNRVQVPKTSSHPYQSPSGHSSRETSPHVTASSQLHRESAFRTPGLHTLGKTTFQPQGSRESVAIMDSQPDATFDHEPMQRPKSLRFPSSPSTNQYSINQTTMGTKTGYTSQVITSSMPPMPPKSSQAVPEEQPGDNVVLEEDRVPSSPPVARHEDDIEYDEHTYDEYQGSFEDQGHAGNQTGEGEIGEGEIVMGEDDDLPTTPDDVMDEDLVYKRDDSVGYEGDLGFVRPQKEEPRTDQEVPETLEQEILRNEPGVHDMAGIPGVPRLRRQGTVPDTDEVDETQPQAALPSDPDNNPELPNQTNSTEPFQTAREELSVSQPNVPNSSESKEGGSDTIPMTNRIRSLNDVYNLPATQQSMVEEIDMPQLSGFDENEHDPPTTRSSPAAPPKKVQKVTYTTKRKILGNKVRPSIESDPLSDPPPPVPKIVEQAEYIPTASAQEREIQGALAARRLREEAQAQYAKPATRKPTGRPKLAKPQNQKKGALKPVARELLQSLSSPHNSPARSRVPVTARSATPPSPSRPSTRGGKQQDDVEMASADEETDELALSTPHSGNVEMPMEDGSDSDVLVPNRVFASWPGSHYYPATCISRSSSRQLQIRYDDGNTTSLDAVHVRALSLRKNDHVKVDEPGMKKNTYIVVGFKDRLDDLAGEEFPTTDCFGYATIVLEEKSRDSLPKGKKPRPAEHISVPMGSVYLTTGLWARFRDRSYKFTPLASPTKSTSRVSTPAAAEAHFATSFSRRGTMGPSLLREAAGRAASVASTTRSGSSVFSNMAFVVTSTGSDFDKESIAKRIKSNGGQILEHGFHELFEASSTDAPSDSADESSAELVLRRQYVDLGFVALISDAHSRSTKYIQALALNVPCLHLRWVNDSIASSRALPFTKYSLPAGVSKFLDPNGVIRSRTMKSYDPDAEDVSFANIVQQRDLLLQGQNVLLVTGKSKKEIEKRQPFVFLTHALGAVKVGRSADLEATSQMLADGQWDWVYVDNGEQGVAEAAAELFGTGKPATGSKAKKGKKRKRDETERPEELLARGELDGRKIRITCAEFVIQSLILGALVDE
ncbi:hypothetical protein IQ07DRAFT_576487 [Pyrenochaeta sp. DS3sAY3a]|nr:hypothetical protein IQ07DRAFT_576487 [Pyrenochaeta sp. DS3sAY3a]